jgi:hypothetical protein
MEAYGDTQRRYRSGRGGETFILRLAGRRPRRLGFGGRFEIQIKEAENEKCGIGGYLFFRHGGVGRGAGKRKDLV